MKKRHKIIKTRGIYLLRDPKLNKGTAFTPAERKALGLRGLLPPNHSSEDKQLEQAYENFCRKESDLEKYIFLLSLLGRNETLFYSLLKEHLKEMIPIVYTPTAGLACQKYSHIFQRPRGLYISLKDRGHVAEILNNWPHDDIRIIVITDGERILGLGDLGANGMGIPIGKLSLYAAAAGIDPVKTLPVCLDVGTNNLELLNDSLYPGLKRKRERGTTYDKLIEEFIGAVTWRWPGCIIQFEDFANTNSFRLLKKYYHNIPCFNDDVQGTGAVVLAGLLVALRITGSSLFEQKIVFLGAGSVGMGIANSILVAMQQNGLSVEEAKKRFWFVDSKGLVTKSRHHELTPQKKEYARQDAPMPDLLSVVRNIRPTVLIGTSGCGDMFSEKIIRSMSRHVAIPIIFALSNPAENAECTAEQAYRWSSGKAVFAGGSPLSPVKFRGETFRPSQANNVYVFPGVGLGAIVTGAKEITDSMFYAAALALSDSVLERDLIDGCIYPPLSKIRETSIKIGIEVARDVFNQGLNTKSRPKDIEALIRKQLWEPAYPEYV